MNTNVWTHLAWVWRSETGPTIYVNGRVCSNKVRLTYAITPVQTSSYNSFEIARSFTYRQYFLRNGYFELDDFYFKAKGFSAAEVSSIYNGECELKRTVPTFNSCTKCMGSPCIIHDRVCDCRPVSLACMHG